MAYVLLIEPNTLLSAAYTKALEHAGHTVAVAHGAQEAVHAADVQTPDIVILEVQLRAHNGIEFLHEFRSYPEWKDVPVVINTSLPPAHMQVAQPALHDEFGVEAIFYKPTATLSELTRAVQRYAVPRV